MPSSHASESSFIPMMASTQPTNTAITARNMAVGKGPGGAVPSDARQQLQASPSETGREWGFAIVAPRLCDSLAGWVPPTLPGPYYLCFQFGQSVTVTAVIFPTTSASKERMEVPCFH
eukprot:scaffold9928_cov112-Isochrysis_galbana.AAC.9